MLPQQSAGVHILEHFLVDLRHRAAGSGDGLALQPLQRLLGSGAADRLAGQIVVKIHGASDEFLHQRADLFVLFQCFRVHGFHSLTNRLIPCYHKTKQL